MCDHLETVTYLGKNTLVQPGTVGHLLVHTKKQTCSGFAYTNVSSVGLHQSMTGQFVDLESFGSGLK